jgi:hypothetical protein
MVNAARSVCKATLKQGPHMKNFRAMWISMLWHAMRLTGNGYKRHSLRNTGKGTDRRRDKLDRPRETRLKHASCASSLKKSWSNTATVICHDSRLHRQGSL